MSGDRLLELGQLRDQVVVPPVRDVLREGRRRRRRRSAVRALAVTALAATAIGVPLAAGDRAGEPHARVFAAGPALAIGEGPAGGECRGLPERQTRDDPRLHYTLSTPPPGMELVLARARTAEWCGPSATPLVALDTGVDGRVTRAFAVWGPAAAGSGLGQADPAGTRTVRGTRGRVWSGDGDGADAIAWAEPDGSRWLATSAGLREEELLALVEELALDGDAGTAELLPLELQGLTLEEAAADPVPPRFTTGWTLLYRSAEGAGETTIAVTRSGPSLFAEAAWPGGGAMVVSVRGQRGLYVPPARGDANPVGTLLWSERGNTFRLTAPSPKGDVAELRAVAELLTPVPTVR